MFRDDPATVSRPPCLCLVAPLSADEAGPEMSVGRRALSLARGGCHLHVLVCDREANSTAWADMEKQGIRVSHLIRLQFPPTLTLPGPNGSPRLDLGDQVRWALAELHRSHHFDRIEFSDRSGLGFRAIQAKRLGLNFAEVPLSVSLQGPSQNLRHLRQEWLARSEDLADDYAERYAFEHADSQVIEDAALSAEVRRLGWQVRDDALGHSPTHQPALTSSPETPLVTVAMPFYNLAPYLDEALASLAAQTYPALEVLVINDGSTDPQAQRVFQEMQARYPRFHFFEQANIGIGATRNRGLAMARGAYFLPMDADNVARPDMISRLVTGLESNPNLAALTCYFLAFQESADLKHQRFLYAYKPTGGPHVLGCLRNIYGDGNALFRTSALRAIGGFTTDKGTSFEDWEVFVKLVNAGLRVDVLPDFLFYYRHRAAGFSRVTSDYLNHQRVLRQYVEAECLSRAERLALWNLLAGLERRVNQLEDDKRTLQVQLHSLRYQLMDKMKSLVNQVPLVQTTMKWLWRQRSGTTKVENDATV